MEKIQNPFLGLPGIRVFRGSVGKKKFNDHPFSYHAELELEIATLTNHGVGLARVALPAAKPGSSQIEPLNSQPETAPSAGAGWVVMVPFTLPGERVRVRVFRNHKNYSEADLVAVLTASPHRIAAPCPLFGRCGGCQYQHLTYAEQLAWKRRQVAELLQHMAGITFEVNPVIGSPREYGYRSKITPHFAAPRGGSGSGLRVQNSAVSELGEPAAPDPKLENQNRGASVPPPIGFLRAGTRFDIIDVPQCAIATDAINDRLSSVRAEVFRRAAEGEYARGATLLLREAGGQVTTDYEAVITEEIALPPIDRSSPVLGRTTSAAAVPPPLKLRFLARDFFQNNPFILPACTAYVRAQAAATGARFRVDAYCGSGLFALSAAPAFGRVVGIELSASSIVFARQNAAANHIANATFQAGDAATIFAGLDPTFTPADTVVIIDPPRKGCDENFLTQLFAFGPRAVVYVSCDPATQMRDLKSFLAAGYTLTDVQPFDLFPQTRHLECVITLQR